MIKNDISVRTTETRRPSGARLPFARVLALFFLLFLVIAPRPVAAIGPVNGDFEEGHLWNYILYPSSRQVYVTEGFLEREDFTPVFGPVQGRYFGLVTTNQMDVYSRLITAPFAAVAGQTISGYAFFQTDEYQITHNDEGQVAILSGGVEVKVVFSQSVEEIGPVNRTDWTYWEYTIPEGGGFYQVEARVVNRGDGMIDSAVGIDSIFLRDAPAPNKAPLLSPIGDKTVNEGATLDFTAFAIDNDPGDVLTYSLTGNVPEGAEFDPVTGRFIWTPGEDQGPGEYKVVVVVTDNGVPAPAADFEEIIITVAEVNQAPELGAFDEYTLKERETLYFEKMNAIDPDLPANRLTFSLVGAPEGVEIDPATGEFSWTPTEEQGPGTYTFAVRATDDGVPNLFAEQSLTVEVKEVNSAPELAPIGDKTVDEEKLFTFTATATDEDLPANRLTYSLAGAPEGASIDPATGAFTWTPTEKQGPGSYTFTVRVTDDGEGSLWDEEEITVTVAEVNKPPFMEPIANKTVKEGELLNFVATGRDPDSPRDLILYSLVDAPAGAHIKEVLGEFNWTPEEDQGGRTYTLAVRVTEEHASHMTAEEWFTITVLEDNNAPELAPIGDKTVKEKETLTFTASATDSDLPANRLTYSLVGAPSRASIHASTGVFTWTPNKSQSPGTYTFTVRVTDNGKPSSLSAEEKITVTVTAADDAPDGSPTPPGGGPVTVPGTPPGSSLLRITDFQPLLAPTNSAGSGAAQITLQTTLQDFAAPPGDITTAVVSIMNRETGQVLASGLRVTPKPLLGLAVGMASHTTTINIVEPYGQTFQACVLVAGGYTRDSTYDDALVTVYQPLTDFLVGGGYLVNQNSAGSLVGDPGEKTHFGMTVKFDLAKNGKPASWSGQATLLLRSGGQVYRVRTSAISKLDLNKKKGEAGLEGTATILNITNPQHPVMVDDNAQFAITLTDRSEPDSSDTLGITLQRSNGSLYFSSNAARSGKAVEQTLGSGDLQLR